MPQSKPTPGAQNWYPNSSHVTPERLPETFRIVLQQHYALQQRFNDLATAHTDLQSQHAALKSQMPNPSQPPPGSGPADTQLLGLRVAPVDTNSLANGATLKFNKSSGQFEFS